MFFLTGEYDDWSLLFITEVSARSIPPRLGSMLVLLQSWGMFVHVARLREASQILVGSPCNLTAWLGKIALNHLFPIKTLWQM